MSSTLGEPDSGKKTTTEMLGNPFRNKRREIDKNRRTLGDELDAGRTMIAYPASIHRQKISFLLTAEPGKLLIV